MPIFTPDDLRAAADFLEALDHMADPENTAGRPTVSVSITNPPLEVHGDPMGSICWQGGNHVLLVNS